MELRPVFFLSDFEVGITLFNWILALSFFPYVGIVLLNITFTSENLTTDDIPCYDSGLYMGLGTFWFDQYFTDWWIVLSDVLYFILPVLTIILMIFINASPDAGYRRVNIVAVGTCFFIKLLTLIIRIYQTIFCSFFQPCRTCPGTCIEGGTCPPNTLWLVMLVWNATWIVLYIIYGILAIADSYRSNAKQSQFMQVYNLELNAVLIENDLVLKKEKKKRRFFRNRIPVFDKVKKMFTGQIKEKIA